MPAEEVRVALRVSVGVGVHDDVWGLVWGELRLSKPVRE